MKNWTAPLSSTYSIQISLGNEIQLKLTNLIFWTEFVEKEYLRFKTKQVNLNVEFCRF